MIQQSHEQIYKHLKIWESLCQRINGTHCERGSNDTQPEWVSDGVMLPRDRSSRSWFNKAESPPRWFMGLCYLYDVTEMAPRSFPLGEVWDFAGVIRSMCAGSSWLTEICSHLRSRTCTNKKDRSPPPPFVKFTLKGPQCGYHHNKRMREWGVSQFLEHFLIKMKLIQPPSKRISPNL